MVSKASVFKSPHTEPTVRLTVAQATVRFLANQYVERDGERSKFFAGCFGIFGHGNVAGMGQALLQAEVEAAQTGTEPALRYVLGRNEQAMVHTAAAYARQKDRLQAWAVTASIGPGSTNMLTGAALATINRLPVLLLPSDTFATRVSAPVLQDLELPHDNEVTVNDAFKPLSRFFDRVWRPEQLPAALLGAMRVLTDPVETGAATIALPQDVQAEAYDWPESLFAERTWHVARPLPERSVIARAAEVIRSAKRPLIVAGGGVIYSGANDALAAFAERTRHPGVGDAGGQGFTPLRSPAVGRCGRLDRHHRRQRVGDGGRRGDRNRHPLQRFHQRIAHGLQQSRRTVRQHQRRLVRRGEAGRPVRRLPMRGKRSRRCPICSTTTPSATNTARAQRNWRMSGTTPSRRHTASRTTGAP